MKIRIMTLTLICVCRLGFSQTFNDKISKELVFEKKDVGNTVLVANVNGDVKVEGYEGDKVVVEVNRTITAKSQERLEKGKKEIGLGTMDRADTLIFYVDGLCTSFGKQNKKKGNWSGHADWGYNWSDCNGRGKNCDPPYDYTMDFTIKVPAGANLVLSTVNDGDVTVANVKGAMHVSNVNGSIKLTNISREASASTINGDVDIEYSRNPEKDCRFYSLNGDINAWFQKGLAANLSFDSFNGDLYTNVAQLEAVPVTLKKEQEGKATHYKVKGNRFKVGSGGVFLDFETFNGNVYLKEKTN